jgi:hypothetical protein
MANNATLFWNSKDHSREHILVLENKTSVNSDRIIDRIFRREKTDRLNVTNRRYFYNPSEEYKQYVLKFKKNN